MLTRSQDSAAGAPLEPYASGHSASSAVGLPSEVVCSFSLRGGGDRARGSVSVSFVWNLGFGGLGLNWGEGWGFGAWVERLRFKSGERS